MNFNIKNFRLLAVMLGFLAALSFTACKLDDLDDPNNPNATFIENGASLAEIQNLVDGVQAGMRNNLPIYFDGVGVIGREFWRFSGSDPRYTTDLLGGGDSQLDAGAFYTANPYGSRYRVIRNCSILENAIDNTPESLTDAQKRAGKGFSKTIRAHELLMALNQQWSNGIRIDVADPDNLGPFVGENDPKAALRAIAALLDEAKADLDAGGAAFPFALRAGFNGFSDPANFAKFNRALLARVQAYSENWDNALTALSTSFYNQAGDLKTGCSWVYSQSGGDLLNELFQAPTQVGEIRIVHPSFIADAEGGDARLSKAFLRADAPTQAGLSGSYGFNVFADNTSPIPIIRNEELILIFAEAKIQKGDAASLTEAETALNRIRNAAGLGNLTAGMTKAALIDEMLKQRRYSLYGEGHRWLDMRRYGRLAQLPIDRLATPTAGADDVWEKFPRPTNE